MPLPQNTAAIASESLSAEIDPMGAQLFKLRDAEGRDLLWNGDPRFWTGRAPILFPIVGALVGGQYCLGAHIYRLPRHGFARTRLFTLIEATGSSALFRLGWDDETRQIYPFLFELDIRFGLAGSTLTVTALVKNRGREVMPAGFGFHPALRWPLPYGQPRAAHRIAFEQEEKAPVRRLDSDGLLLPNAFPTPVRGRELALHDDLFTDDAVIFDALASRRLLYGAAAGPQIEITFAEMPYLGVWTKPGADFICIEPWHGIADPQGFHGDFADKPGLFQVAPGQAQSCRMTISLRP